MTMTPRQFEICQEARFVLWALRCAVAWSRGEPEARTELQRGFELADVPETTTSFLEFSRRLCAVTWEPTTWHHPRCCCVSPQELLMLQALSGAAHRLRRGDAAAVPLWHMLVPDHAVEAVDASAREWLVALDRAGIRFPAPEELLECLRPLEAITAPAGSHRIH